jgi:hypothetical protein
MKNRQAPYFLALVRDALGQGGIDEGLKLSKGLRVGSVEVPAGLGDVWVENSIRMSTALSAGAYGGTTALGPSAAWLPVPMNTEAWDTDDIFDLAVSTSQMLINTSGVYQMYGYVTFAVDATGIRGIGIMLNGTTLLGSWLIPPLASKTYMTINVTWRLTEGDYVELVIYQNTAGALDVEAPLFSVARVP